MLHNIGMHHECRAMHTHGGQHVVVSFVSEDKPLTVKPYTNLQAVEVPGDTTDPQQSSTRLCMSIAIEGCWAPGCLQITSI